ncbi:MAG: Eco29kI family restriction endonuclease [Kiritimatiellia bacterium]
MRRIQRTVEGCRAVFHGTPVCKFPPEERFAGAGVYAIYCIGKTGPYAKFGQEINREEYRLPIYVGKAEPTGWRHGDLNEQLTAIKTMIVEVRGLMLMRHKRVKYQRHG